MMKIEDMASLEKLIEDLKGAHEALPLLIFEMGMILAMAKREAGITGPILQPPEAPPVEAVAA